MSVPPYTTRRDAMGDPIATEEVGLFGPMAEKVESQDPCEDATVPGFPLVRADDAAAVRALLIREMAPTRLNRLHSILFLASNRDNISPLHHQAIKSRTICITERPDLHLVWHYDRIFVKPVPEFLLGPCPYILAGRVGDDIGNDDAEGNALWLDVAGFMRSYSRLVEHESDLRIAQKLNLLPSSMTWPTWCRIARPYRDLLDRHVGRRYHYGEIRLTRLNFWHALLHGRSYLPVHHNYATFFGRFGPSYLLVFGAVAVLLTAVQVGMDASPDRSIYHDMAAKAVPFSLILTVLGLAFLPALFLFLWARELYFYIFSHRPRS